MRRFLRVVAILAGAGLAALLGAYLIAIMFGEPPGKQAATLPVPVTPQLVSRGAYLARVGDCSACHTAPHGPRMAGGLAMQTPVGVIYSPNITPDVQTGIGGYSYGEFRRALLRGIGASGKPLYPAMPYPSYSRLREGDVEALYAYFMHGVKPVHKADKRAAIPWPLSLRWPLVYWRWLFAPRPRPFTPQPGQAPDVARGAYLVEGLGHCGACHTPRGLAFEEDALTPQGGPQYLSGSQFNGWYAPSIRGGGSTGIGLWSGASVEEFLKTGKTRKYAAFGAMGDVVMHSTQHLTRADQAAIADFLHTLRPHAEAMATPPPTEGVLKTGQSTYDNNCSACHGKQGQGMASSYPALSGNPIVNTPDPTSLIHIVLDGASEVKTRKVAQPLAMPAFGSALSDKQIADLLSFVRSSWKNKAPAVTPDEVGTLRSSLKGAGRGSGAGSGKSG